jgi:hypothetical protein
VWTKDENLDVLILRTRTVYTRTLLLCHMKCRSDSNNTFHPQGCALYTTGVPHPDDRMGHSFQRHIEVHTPILTCLVSHNLPVDTHQYFHHVLTPLLMHMIRLWGAKFQGNDAIKIAKVSVANASRAVHPMVCNTELRTRADCRLEAVKLPHLPWSQRRLYKLIKAYTATPWHLPFLPHRVLLGCDTKCSAASHGFYQR